MVFASLLAACSSPTVYLYAKHLTPKEQTKITNALKNKGYNVEINQLKFPQNINSTSILYSPMLSKQGYESLNQLISLAESLDIPVISTELMRSGNHSVSSDGFAFFVVPDSIDLEKARMALFEGQVFKAENCESHLNITIREDNEIQLSAGSLNSNDGDVLGFYEIRGNGEFLAFTPEPRGRIMHFEIHRGQQIEKVGLVQTTRLSPMSDYKHLKNCQFVYGEVQKTN